MSVRARPSVLRGTTSTSRSIAECTSCMCRGSGSGWRGGWQPRITPGKVLERFRRRATKQRHHTRRTHRPSGYNAIRQQLPRGRSSGWQLCSPSGDCSRSRGSTGLQAAPQQAAEAWCRRRGIWSPTDETTLPGAALLPPGHAATPGVPPRSLPSAQRLQPLRHPRELWNCAAVCLCHLSLRHCVRC